MEIITHMRKFLQSLDVAPENYGLLGTIYFALFTSGIMSVMLGTLLPYIRYENALSYAQSGLLLSAHQLGSLFAVLAAGILPYAIGRKKSTLLMGAGITVGLVCITIFRSPWLLMAAFAFTGIGRGTMTNICNVVASDVSGNRAGALNLLHAIFAVGALLSPIIVYVSTGPLGLSWKFSALTSAALAVTALILIALSKLSNSPSQKETGGALSFFKNLSFWHNSAILFFYICAEASIMGWFVLYFEDTGVLSPGAAKLTPTLLWLMMMVGRLSCSAISSRVNKNKLLLVLSLGFAACFTGMLLSRSALVCVFFLLGIGLSMAGIYPTTLSAMQGTLSTVSAGFAICIASAGGIVMPGIVGAVADVHGLAGGVAMILTALAGMLVLIVVKLAIARHDSSGLRARGPK